MKEKIKLELPIYFTTSKLKPQLVGMNWYRNVHYHQERMIKKFYHSLIAGLLPSPRPKLKGEIKVEYVLYYKNKQSDLMNIVSVIDKYLLDGLQAIGVIENDNVENYVKTEIRVAEQDKKRPRLMCEIMEI